MADEQVPQTPQPESVAPQPAVPTTAPTPDPQGVNMISPDGTSIKVVPPKQIEDAKSAGWQPAIKMFNNQDSKQVKWVPSAQIDEAHRQNWFPVLSSQQQTADEKDSINPSVSGNAALMAAPLAVPAAVGSGLENLVGAATKPAIDLAGKAIENLPDHMMTLDKIYKTGKALGWTAFGIKEAGDLYKTLSSWKGK